MAEIDPLRAFGLLQGADLGGEASRELGQDQSLVQGPPRLGELLEGRFRLLRPLGQGGMGTVFLGRDEELEREVAIKVLSAGGEGPRQRFMREAEVTARLSHPHVIRIHGSGQVRGHPYLVYELVPGGKSLEDAFQTAPLEQRLDLVAQVAAGLAAAHQAGVVHRDLKPENVLIRPDGTAVVADFGLAGLDESSLTRTGQTMGTPAYMAPEQVRGESATPACDVWALGLLLYEALYEEHALLDEGSGLQVLLARIYEARVELPRGGPPALRRLLEQTLVADPAERPPDAAAFARALTEARGSSGGRRGPIAGLGLAAVALIAALAVSLWPGKSEAEPSPAVSTPAAASPTTGAKPSPQQSDSSKQEFPQPLARARWAAFLGEERFAVGDGKYLVVCDLEGRVQRRLPGNYFLIRQGPAGLWLSDEAGAYWLRASDLELEELVKGRILDCDPERREILVRTKGGVEIRGAGGELVRALAPPEHLKVSAGFLLPGRVLLSIWKPRTFSLVAERGDPSSVLREDGRLGDRVRTIAISPDRTRIGIGTGAGWVLFGPADLQTLDPLSRQRKGGGLKNVSIQAHNNKVAGVVLRGDFLLSFSRPSDDPGDAVLWDLRTQKPTAIRDARRIRAVALSPAGRVAIVGPDSVEVMRLEDFE